MSRLLHRSLYYCEVVQSVHLHSSISSSCDELCGYAELHPSQSHPLSPVRPSSYPCPFPDPTSSLPHSPRTSPRRAPRPGTRPAQRRTARTAPPAPAGDRGRRLEARMAQEEPRPRLDRRRRPAAAATRNPARSPPTARVSGGPADDSGPGSASIATAGPRRLPGPRWRPGDAAAGRRTTQNLARKPLLTRGSGPADDSGPGHALIVAAGLRPGLAAGQAAWHAATARRCCCGPTTGSIMIAAAVARRR